MGHLTFILGGARSGKSRRAQELTTEDAAGGAVLYIATAEASDEEMAHRIARHKEDRPAHWRTIEEPRDVAAVLRENGDAGVVLIDCLTLYITNHLLANGDAAHCEAKNWDETSVDTAVRDLLMAIRETPARVVLVSNEVGMGLVPTTPLGRAFRDIAGRANQQVAASADRVVFMVAGLPMVIKDA